MNLRKSAVSCENLRFGLSLSLSVTLAPSPQALPDRRVLRGGRAVGFYSNEGVLRRVLRRGSEGVPRRCLERRLREYDPLGVRHIRP